MQWHDRPFAALTIGELYAITVLRERVFIVEQRCIYQDADGLDPASRHVWAGSAETIHAYVRIVPAGLKFAELSIGRVIVAPESRGARLGVELMQRGIAAAGAVPIRIGAQAHLERFYSSLGFVRTSEIYDDDGIPHIEMLRLPTGRPA